MLRTLFVLSIALVGLVYAFRGPFYVLLFYVWNAYFRPEFWVWDFAANLINSLRLSYLSGVAVIASTFITRQRLYWSGHCFFMLVILLHSFLSVLLAERRDVAWMYWVDFFKAMTITLLIPTLANDRNKLRLLVLIMCLSLGFEGAKQGWAGLFYYPGGQNLNEIPFLGDNNGVAIGMLMLAPLLGALGATTTRKWPKRFYFLLTVGVIYRAVVTYSRGGFLSCGMLALIYWLRSKEKIKLLFAFALTAAIVLPVLPEEFWGRMETIKTFEEVEDVSAISRLHFWEVAVKMANANPLLGVGFHAYNESYNDYDFSYGRFGAGRSVHSVWFGVLGELGYLGLGLYILNLIFSLRNCAYARKVSRRNPEYSDLQRFATSIETSIWVFLLGGSFLPFQYNEMLWHMLGLSIALKAVAKSIEATGSGFSRDPLSEEEPQFEFQGAGS